MNYLFKKNTIKELMKLGPMSKEEAEKYFNIGYEKEFENWDDSEYAIEDVADPEEYAEYIFDKVINGEYDDELENYSLKEAKKILEENGYILEDFGIGVGGLTGADQGIPHGGDCKAVVAFRMDGGKPKSRKWFIKKKKKRKASK